MWSISAAWWSLETPVLGFVSPLLSTPALGFKPRARGLSNAPHRLPSAPHALRGTSGDCRGRGLPPHASSPPSAPPGVPPRRHRGGAMAGVRGVGKGPPGPPESSGHPGSTQCTPLPRGGPPRAAPAPPLGGALRSRRPSESRPRHTAPLSASGVPAGAVRAHPRTRRRRRHGGEAAGGPLGASAAPQGPAQPPLLNQHLWPDAPSPESPPPAAGGAAGGRRPVRPSLGGRPGTGAGRARAGGARWRRAEAPARHSFAVVGKSQKAPENGRTGRNARRGMCPTTETTQLTGRALRIPTRGARTRAPRKG